MDALDVVLIVLCVLFGVSGYRQGLLVGVLAFVGLLGGGAIGAHYAPAVRHHLHIDMSAAAFGLGFVVVCSVVGQLLATMVGVAIRRQLEWSVLAVADAAAGAALSVVSVLLVAWLIGTAVAQTTVSGLAGQVRGSAVLRGVDDVVPEGARTWFAGFRRLLDRGGLPEVFASIGPENIVPVQRPDPALAHSRAVRVAQGDVVKVTGTAPSCSRSIEGSGFVYAADRVMTNAHVVAGVRSPQVHTSDGETFPATVVRYDPERDVAVLRVDGLDRTPLSFGGTRKRGQGAVVIGYPENGPLTAGAARVRALQDARGPDIYQEQQVTRQVYSLYAVVRPGNSGGPMLSPSGQVAGVVFALAVDNDHTGYALSAAEVAGDAAAGRTATAPVSTRGCD
jgi:S1-C subfamily serine protease